MRSARPALAPLAARRVGVAPTKQSRSTISSNSLEFQPFGIAMDPFQSRWEFRKLLTEIERIRPETMLEIGTARGGSLLAFTQLCTPDAHIVSVDLPRGPFGGGYPAWKVPLYKGLPGLASDSTSCGGIRTARALSRTSRASLAAVSSTSCSSTETTATTV